MGSPKFDKHGICRIKDIDDEFVSLSKSVWEFKISKPERQHLRYNFDKIKETLRSPDTIRESKRCDDTILYYKAFDTILLQPGTPLPANKQYICVVVAIENGQKRVKTFYDTNRIKK